ncbi:MAG: hypothetical protein ICV83_08580 [Cytophagales bacterium]|nr:hypothetical protein [Cytophagales bacterium]
MNETAITKINKEDIARLSLRAKEVCATPEERVRRRLNLQKAVWLGNTNKLKVTLCFGAGGDMYEVETTIWSVTDTHVGLKGGLVLPVACIYHVQL